MNTKEFNVFLIIAMLLSFAAMYNFFTMLWVQMFCLISLTVMVSLACLKYLRE